MLNDTSIPQLLFHKGSQLALYNIIQQQNQSGQGTGHQQRPASLIFQSLYSYAESYLEYLHCSVDTPQNNSYSLIF